MNTGLCASHHGMVCGLGCCESNCVPIFGISQLASSARSSRVALQTEVNRDAENQKCAANTEPRRQRHQVHAGGCQVELRVFCKSSSAVLEVSDTVRDTDYALPRLRTVYRADKTRSRRREARDWGWPL